MNSSMINAGVTMSELQKRLDTLAHNMANSQSTGFKKRDTSFTDLLAQQVYNRYNQKGEAGRLTPTGIRVGSGARVSDTSLNMKQGVLQTTNRSLDVALAVPSHFFQVQGDDGVIEYTRDGAFYLRPTGANTLQLVTSDGKKVLGNKGAITIPSQYKEISIGQNGNISVTLKDGRVINNGNLAVVDAINPQLLQAVGHNFRIPPDVFARQVMRGVVNQDIAIQQGALEMSNVDMGDEMTDLMETQRSYQFNARTITTSDQMMGLINGIR
ncbi:flagellar hook-basal body protein [Fictibacillus macauensis ZFHKF-1]|uniref:Flagellar hook-basal body protein n=1 Tax=Fictibacillus macauensis ZFHKF-1 TaxID=1196324 RepID=I8AE67_9BACL|nr:flagellar hook-basal body protein [Fictibacillus macauensis]EIT83882.1 flagellar hook-basal body protein [Fictibacillus macauensis ZFHKF-1]